MSAAQETKARKYLAEGRVRVTRVSMDPLFFVAQVQGSKTYAVTYDGTIWMCGCEARTVDCVHVIACKLIAPVTFLNKPEYVAPDPDLNALFSPDSHQEAS